ncbi:inversin [Pelobates fuscus]|uniref:inversin n=1 Tax=Pelobates fuscus TaxID=191477 RepID=UPI002FE4F530
MQSAVNFLPQGSSLASPVHAAAVTGDKATLLRLIGSNSGLTDQEDQLGRTPLMYSVLGDRKACAEALLRHGAQVNRCDRSGRSALHLAAQAGNHRLLKLLLARKADCTHRDLRDITALHLSTRHQDTRCLALLLKNTPPGQVDAQDQRKQTALHWSAYYNRPRHVRLLVRHGSNIGIPDQEGKIPLHWAAGHKDPEAAWTVRCLLEAAPTESLLNWQDYEGRTPLHLAVGDGNQEVVRLLMSYRGCNGAPYDNLFRTPLHWAALLGHTSIAQQLLERNHSPNILSDSQGATPLHYAAQGNCPDTVRVLLSHSSVRDEADLEGRTAFMWAAGKGSDEAIKAMLELDSNLEVNRTDKYGGTALHAASLSGQISTVRILLENGAQVDACDVMKHTPLFRACEMGHREVIRTLIKGGAKVQLVDKDGRSPLHSAALGGNANVCQILIENNINPNAQDYEGRTPLHCSAYGGYIGCMEVLIENKADPNIQDKNGRTALHWSCNNGYLDAVKLLLKYDAFPNQMENTEERYTPFDYALLGGHQEVIQFMLEHGALSIAAIQDIAASKIQAVYKGHKVRRAFRERKNLLMKHEQLRKGAAAKKREGENKRKTKLLLMGQEKKKEDSHKDEYFFSVKQDQSQDQWTEKRQSEQLTEVSHEPKEEGESEHQAQNRTAQQVPRKETSPRHKDPNMSPVVANVRSVAQISASASEHSEKQYNENGPNQSQNENKKTSRHTKEISDVMQGSGDYELNETVRRSHRVKKGTSSAFSPKRECNHQDTENHELDIKECNASDTSIYEGKANIQKVTKNTTGHSNKRGTEDLIQKLENCSLLNVERRHSSRRLKPGSDSVIDRMLDHNNYLKGRETGDRQSGQPRKPRSSQNKQRPVTGKPGQNEERKTRKAHWCASAVRCSVPYQNKHATACTKYEGNSSSYDAGFKRAQMIPLSRENTLGENCKINWQHLDIEFIPLQARLLLVEREKARKQLFHLKYQAATVIQRAWRAHRNRRKCNTIRKSRSNLH